MMRKRLGGISNVAIYLWRSSMEGKSVGTSKSTGKKKIGMSICMTG